MIRRRARQASSSAAGSPSHQVATDGSSSGSPRRRRASGQVAEQRARLEHARAERVGEHHVAAPRAFGQAGDAERGVGAQLERVAIVVVLAAHDRVHALQAVDRLQPDAVVAHRQVAALDQRQSRGSAPAAHARSRSRCTGPASAARSAAARRRAAPSAAATRAARRSRRRGAAPAARGTSAGTRARRPAGSPAHSPRPRAPGCGRSTTHQRPSGERARSAAYWNRCMPPAGCRPCAGCRKPRWPNTTGGGSAPLFSSVLRPVDVGEHAVEQVGALRDAGLDLRPTRRPTAASGSGSTSHGRSAPFGSA